MSIQHAGCCVKVQARDHLGEAALFKALADPHRLSIIDILVQNQSAVCVCDFTAILPLNQSTVSHHLKILKDAGLINAERRGTWVYYSLAENSTHRLAAAVRTVMSERIPV